MLTKMQLLMPRRQEML